MEEQKGVVHEVREGDIYKAYRFNKQTFLDWLDLNLVQVNILCYKNLFSESRLCVDHLAQIFKLVN